MLPFMNVKRLPLFTGLFFSVTCHAFSAAECSEYLHSQYHLLNEIGLSIQNHQSAFWVLYQTGYYGVVTGEPSSITLKYRSETLGTFRLNPRLNPIHIPRLFVFGHLLKHNFDPAWLGYFNVWVYCIGHAYNGFSPFDVCCFYDENPRKHKLPPSDQEPSKKLLLIDQVKPFYLFSK